VRKKDLGGDKVQRLTKMSDTERDTISPVPVSPTKLKGAADSSDDESSEIVNNGETDSSSTDNGDHLGTNGVTNRVNGSSTDSEEDVDENELEKHEAVTNGNGFTVSGEPEFKPKKAADSDSSDTEDQEDSDGESEGEIVDKMDHIDVNDGCISSKVADEDCEEEGMVKITETAPSPEPEEDLSPEPEESLSPEPVESHALERSPSPEELSHKSPSPDRSRSPTPERKDSRGSNGSSSYDEERASSLSPEPPKVIATPTSKLTSPVSPPPSQNKSAITKIYTEALVNDSDGEDGPMKATRAKPTNDITQIYTQKIAEAESPKPERAKFSKPNKDITQLYTAAFNKDGSTATTPGKGEPIKPRRNENITKLYTGGLDTTPEKSFKGKPNDELTNPRKHNMATAVDKEAIKEAYNEVMADKNGVEWAAFTFTDNKLGVTAKGEDFESFKTHFGPDDRGFGYIKIMTGDEMSKRSKFVFCTWVGPNVSVMKKAKMSTDKALMKEIIQNLSVELQIENANEFSMDHFKAEVDKAGGARY